MPELHVHHILAKIELSPNQEVYPLLKVVTSVGRSEGHDIQVIEESVSRLHFEIRKDAESVCTLTSSGRSGTKVNGERVSAQELKNGDFISIPGVITFQFVAETRQNVHNAIDASDSTTDFSK